jgi:predicted metalloendopeptidase
VGMTFNVPGNSGHLDNVIRIRHFFFRKEIEKINRPTDRSLWLCSPATVNAFYHPALNEIVLPAAFLQSPMFDSSADLAVQYGSLGAMIGHEISHGFDKIGRRYDGDGNLRDWWKPKDVEEYSKREQAMVLQMNKYNVEMGFHGDLTLGENLADLSGLSLASGAFAKILLRDDISLETRIDGFTPWQRFYVSWARSWREIDNESEKPSLRFKSHSPNEFRCNNPLKNISRVYETFDIQPKSGMYLFEGDRTELW